jgi:cell wall-associated NlpC family hydrolase
MSLLGLAIILPVAVVAMLLQAATQTVPSPSVSLFQAVSTGIGPIQASLSGAATGSGSQDAVAVARTYLGIRYVFGGTDPAVGLDCSGLVQLVYGRIGIKLPRTAQQQFDATSRVPPDQLQPGDLVFFARTYADPHDWITHVGIYVGNGQQINAPTEGQVVSIQPVFTGFWGDHFVSGGRAPGR